MAEKKNYLTKEDLANELATSARLTKGDAAKAVDILFSSIAKGLLDKDVDGVRISGFGSFEVVQRKERNGVNPSDSNKKIVIPATKAVKFKPSKTLKDLVKGN